MKTLIVAAVVTLIAGCSGMGMRASGGTDQARSAGAASAYDEQERIFNSWTN